MVLGNGMIFDDRTYYFTTARNLWLDKVGRSPLMERIIDDWLSHHSDDEIKNFIRALK